MREDFVIAAPVLARSSEEADRLFSALRALARFQAPIFLVDGGSPDDFLRRIKQLDFLSVAPVQGDGARLVSQARQAIARAAAQSGKPVILYTEPDKQWFFENGLSDFLASALVSTASSDTLFIPARDRDSFSTFPALQQETEAGLERLMNHSAHVSGDVTYGPLLLPAASAALLEGLPEDLGWGWRIYLLTQWKRLGKPIRFVDAYLPCPPDQQGENEERHQIYRLEQMAQNIRGLMLAMKTELPEQG